MSIIFEGKSYNIKYWMNLHPGGFRLLESANNYDITELYKSYHLNKNLCIKPEYINKCLPTNKQEYIFSEKYKKIQYDSYSVKWISCDPNDIIMWFCFIVYILNLNCILSALMLIILGGYGHQYVHMSSEKSSMLTLVGFISNQWRDEHVFSHHPYTNTNSDIDLKMIMDANKIPLPSILRFVLVSAVIVVRPFIQYFIPKYIKKSTFIDLCFMIYNLYDISYNINYYWFIKRYIPSVWFLIIDYFNHYQGVELTKVSNDWLEQQVSTTQNFVFCNWLYINFPFVHSLLTFGLDRQIEHHLCPKIKMEHLSKVDLSGLDIKIHYFGLKSMSIIYNKFV